MNAGEFGRTNNRTTMGSSSNTSIAKKARTRPRRISPLGLCWPSSVVSMTFRQTHRAF